MARGRMINNSLSYSDKFNSGLKSDKSRLLYILMYTHCDKEGRLSADVDEIKYKIVPRLRYSLDKIKEILQELHDIRLIVLYEVKGKPYMEFIDFEKNQIGLRKDREGKTKIPAYPDQLRTNSGLTPPERKGKERKRKETKGKEDKNTSLKNEFEKEFEDFWEVYPRKMGKQDAKSAFFSLLKQMKLSEIISAVNGYNDYLKEKRISKGIKFEEQWEFIKYPASFLRKDRWKDYVGFVYKPRL